MPVPQIICNGNCWGVYSWTTGFRSRNESLSLQEEIRKNPKAVLNWLMNEGRWDEAEEILDTFF